MTSLLRKRQKKIESFCLKPITNSVGKYVFFCPGCNDYHIVNTNPKESFPYHTLTGNLKKPTIRASVLSIGNKNVGKHHCHSFITKGRISFLKDCTHELAGKTVDMLPVN